MRRGLPLHRNRALFEKLSDEGSPHALSAGCRPAAHRSHFPARASAEEVNAAI